MSCHGRESNPISDNVPKWTASRNVERVKWFAVIILKLNICMNRLLEYLDLPKLPAELSEEAKLSTQINPNVFIFKDYSAYKIFDATESISVYTRSIFDFPHHTKVQLISGDIAIHIDYGRSVVYNYLIDCPGEIAYSCHYQTSEPASLISKEVLTPECWSRLDVSVYHNLLGVKVPRLFISVAPIEKISKEDIRRSRQWYKEFGAG